MKIIFGLLVLAICSNECRQQPYQISNQVQDDMVITYEANTRGFYEKIWITKSSVSFSNDRSLKIVVSSKCQSEDWEDLVALMKEIKLQELPELEPPSKMHQYDGAAMATLKVELNNTVYKTKIFDHGHPPKAISQLVNKVLSIKEMVVKH
ncbi:MAG TPA: hypothetical protein VGA80_12855 [Flavobacteriaceae bacterium]